MFYFSRICVLLLSKVLLTLSPDENLGLEFFCKKISSFLKKLLTGQKNDANIKKSPEATEP